MVVPRPVSRKDLAEKTAELVSQRWGGRPAVRPEWGGVRQTQASLVGARAARRVTPPEPPFLLSGQLCLWTSPDWLKGLLAPSTSGFYRNRTQSTRLPKITLEVMSLAEWSSMCPSVPSACLGTIKETGLKRARNRAAILGKTLSQSGRGSQLWLHITPLCTADLCKT